MQEKDALTSRAVRPGLVHLLYFKDRLSSLKAHFKFFLSSEVAVGVFHAEVTEWLSGHCLHRTSPSIPLLSGCQRIVFLEMTVFESVGSLSPPWVSPTGSGFLWPLYSPHGQIPPLGF